MIEILIPQIEYEQLKAERDFLAERLAKLQMEELLRKIRSGEPLLPPSPEIQALLKKALAAKNRADSPETKPTRRWGLKWPNGSIEFSPDTKFVTKDKLGVRTSVYSDDGGKTWVDSPAVEPCGTCGGRKWWCLMHDAGTCDGTSPVCAKDACPDCAAPAVEQTKPLCPGCGCIADGRLEDIRPGCHCVCHD